mmetsp:Transcript_11153/g.23711  ORF Transcript_11153/g.23711 Transcript_11153/m.23711 type:complete len:703 (+) Transcript_11153:199-2307(+)
MLAYPIATALLLLGQGSSAATAKKKTGTSSRTHHPEKPNFLRKMDGHKNHARRKLSIKEFEAELYGDSKKSAELRKKVIEKSTMVKPPGGGGDKRKLQNYNNNANNANNPYNNNGNYAYDEDGNIQYKYSNNNEDGTDDYFQSNGGWENAFGFDVSQFSLSYHRCAAVRQYDDQIAAMEDTDSVFATQRFAVFRFCPAQTCMENEDGEEDWECDEDTYGEEYCAALEEYMEQMEENAQNYKQYGSGWNGYNQNGGYDQAMNWMQVNQGNYQDNGYNYANNVQYQQQENEDLVGARGEGCQSNYGEYMMEMDQYLSVMLEWQEERFEQYCEYCRDCMWDVYLTWLENGGDNSRKLTFEEFKNSEEHRNLGNDDDDEIDEDYYKVCPEYDTCSEYQFMCNNGFEDDYSEYFECTEVESKNGNVAYIGPHCSEDGFTISLGVYSDEYCNEYIGDGVDIANFIGEEIDYEEDLFHDYYNSVYGSTLNQLQYINEDNVCIPCRKADLLWEDRENNNRGDGRNDDDDDNDDDSNTGNGEINELCENIYMVTARCDKHYRSYSSKINRAQYAEAVAQEDLTCDFIDSIVMGNYNEMGEVDMVRNQRQNGWTANNSYKQQKGHFAEVSPLQIFGLIASIAAVCIFAMWSMTLHKSLSSNRGSWRPRRGMLSFASSRAAEADIDRQNSGIMNCRDIDRQSSGIMNCRSTIS